jgi:hypothetical protein
MPFRFLAPRPDELGLKPGTHRFDGVGDWAHHRFHLRVDSSMNGVLLIDAAKIVFMNGRLTAT